MHVFCIGTDARICETIRSNASRAGRDAVSFRWDAEAERLLAGIAADTSRLVVVHSAKRTEAEVLRAVREGCAVAVLVGIHQEPVDALMQLRPYLTDDEMAVVSRALGF